MNEAIELHDSVLEAVDQRNDTVVVTLMPAVFHKSEGKPGVDAGSTFIQDLMIEFYEAEYHGTVGELPADILHGDFEAGETLSPNMIRLPWDTRGAVQLTLYLHPDYRRLSITGKHMAVRRISEPECEGSFPP
jgi:hypothetical protein